MPTLCLRGLVQLHCGQYEQARASLQRTVELCRQYAPPTPPESSRARALLGLGAAALAETDYAGAKWHYEECAARLHGATYFWDLQVLNGALADLAVTEWTLGHTARARHHLGEALRTVECAGGCAFSLPMVSDVFLAGGLLLSDRGEAERAVELFSLAYRLPHVSNSRWYADVFGKHMAAVEETLPPDVVAAAQERGRARDPHAAAAELLAELESDDGV
jgi:tetratricopeptide (TPR) repeat protein